MVNIFLQHVNIYVYIYIYIYIRNVRRQHILVYCQIKKEYDRTENYAQQKI